MIKVMVSMTKDMVEALEAERVERKLSSIPEVVRVILSDYLKNKGKSV